MLSHTKGEILPPPHPSCTGNPFHLSEYSREEAVSKYREYFYDRVHREDDFRKYLKTLVGKSLGCFCKEKDREVACHCDIIKEYLDSLL